MVKEGKINNGPIYPNPNIVPMPHNMPPVPPAPVQNGAPVTNQPPQPNNKPAAAPNGTPDSAPAQNNNPNPNEKKK